MLRYAAVALVALAPLAAVKVQPLASLVLLAAAFFLHRRSQKQVSPCDAKKKLLEASNQAGAFTDPGYAEHEDHVRWSIIPSTGIKRTNMRKASMIENEFVKLRFLVLHRPTHDKSLDASNKWSYGWHFAGRKRTWEVRCQIQWKRKPKSDIHFGVEMAAGQEPVKGFAAKVKVLILKALGTAIGKEFYETAGDGPDSTAEELEPATFVMPLWAVDQFLVSEVGEQPDLTGDFNHLGIRRTDGFQAYKDAMVEAVGNVQLDKVYTLLFWGMSPYIDVNLWQFQGFGFSMDASKLSGPPPIYCVAYELRESDTDERGADGKLRPKKHLISKKDYYYKVALWSQRSPPDPQLLREVLCLDCLDDKAVNEGDEKGSNGNKVSSINPMLEFLQMLPRCGGERHPPKNGSCAQKRNGQKVFGGCLGHD